ncbi:MAG: DNA replication and repair protein RecF, partial [Ferruginibacter sp.]
TSGVHKDDIQFLLDGFNFKSIASQGQRKSLLFALKLSEYDWIKNIKGFAPLLLLDDIFEKLDEDRIQHLLGWVCKEAGAQVFISDTNPERLKNMFEKFNISPQIFLLK